MMQTSPLFTVAAILVLSNVDGLRKVVWYHPVAGNCSNDLRAAQDFNPLTIDSGFWYHQYNSFGQVGDRCSTGHAVLRGNKTYVDLLLLDPKTNYYLSFSLDVTLHKNQGGVFTDTAGAVGHMISTDLVNYFYYVQCITINGQDEEMAAFATRTPVMNAESKQAYQKTTAKLQQKHLLPPMYKVPQVNCPPLYHVVAASDGLPIKF